MVLRNFAPVARRPVLVDFNALPVWKQEPPGFWQGRATGFWRGW
jgi:hypothetical protein